MIVTFRCDGKVGGYKPGRIYEVELTPYLAILLRNGGNLVLIDPISLDEPEPEPVVKKDVQPDVEPLLKPEPEPVKEVIEDGESSDIPEGNTRYAGSSGENRTPKKSRERSEGSEETSSGS